MSLAPRHARLPTLAEAVVAAAAALRDTSPTARLDAEILTMHVADVSRSDLIAHADQPLTPAQTAALDALVARRHAGEPIAYIVGRREFWSLDLVVSPATLIPRPETELVVERALAHLPIDTTAVIADLGTGSGAIALALARECPRARLIAVDCSPAALAVAAANAERLAITNVEFRAGDWLAALESGAVDMIVSNPPYVADDDPHLLQGDVRFEPRVALAAGARGLGAIETIASDGFARLSAGGWLIVEHASAQAAAVQALLAARGYVSIRCYADLAGRERVTECRRP